MAESLWSKNKEGDRLFFLNMVYNALPNNTQIELVEGCNNFCSFCGIHGIWDKKENRVIKRMDFELIKQLAKAFGVWWKSGKRIEFAMHGEPTLHHNLHETIALFRENNPLAQLQVTTNGLIISREGPAYVRGLFDAGLNFLLVDTYKKKEQIVNVLRSSGQALEGFYDKGSHNPYYYHGPAEKVIILIDDLGVMSGKKRQRVILNHAGNCNPDNLLALGVKQKRLPLIKKCSRPFREITVHHDGTVPLCCIDWKHEFIIGKFPEQSFPDMWKSRIMNTMRNFLFQRQRNFRPCYKCDYDGGFRLGLLKWEPTKITDDDVQFVLSHLQEMKRYEHQNAANEPFLYQGKGITDYF